MSKVIHKRLSDVPIIGMDYTSYPYLLQEGYLSDVSQFVPNENGGYKQYPEPTAFYTPGDGEVIIGASKVGAIATGETPQITVATRKTSQNALYQYKVIADGTASLWKMLFGSSQDYDRTRILYHRKDGKEYTLGWVHLQVIATVQVALT